MTSSANRRRFNNRFDAASINEANAEVAKDDTAKPLWYKLFGWFGGVIVVLVALVPIVPSMLAWVKAANVKATLPDLTVLATVPLAVQIHLASVSICLPLGAYVLSTTKGTSTHKIMGRIWVGAMATACVSALLIESFAPVLGPFGLIHLLVLWSLYSLTRGMVAILWQNDLKSHLRNMQGAYWGLIIAGLFSFVPGRLMWSMFTTM